MCSPVVSWLGISTIWHWERTATPTADRLWHSGDIIISWRLVFNSSGRLLHVADQQFCGLQKGEELVLWPSCSVSLLSITLRVAETTGWRAKNKVLGETKTHGMGDTVCRRKKKGRESLKKWDQTRKETKTGQPGLPWLYGCISEDEYHHLLVAKGSAAQQGLSKWTDRPPRLCDSQSCQEWLDDNGARI